MTVMIVAAITMKPKRTTRQSVKSASCSVHALHAAPFVNSSPVLPVLLDRVHYKVFIGTFEERKTGSKKKATQRSKADAGLVTETLPFTVYRKDRDEAIYNFAMSPEMKEDTPEVRRAILKIRANGGEVDPKSKAIILAFWLDEQLQRWKKCPPKDRHG